MQQSKHRHRRENGDGGGGESPTGGGNDDGELENFIALAPDEADIYNFSNNLINAVDDAAAGGGTENANEVNPFNEFLNPRHSSHQQQQQRQMQGKQQLPEDPWGLDLDEQLPPPDEAQRQEDEADNEVEKSKYLSSGSSLEPVNRSQQPAGGSPLMASSIDFLNSIDGGYLLSNGIIDEQGTKLIDGK